MEDTHSIVLSLPKHPSFALVAVYDGHGGSEVSNFLSSHLPQVIDALSDLHDHEAIENAMIELDKIVLEK